MQPLMEMFRVRGSIRNDLFKVILAIKLDILKG